MLFVVCSVRYVGISFPEFFFACFWFRDGLGTSLFFGIGFNLPSVWLMGWFGSRFMFDSKFTYVGLDNYL